MPFSPVKWPNVRKLEGMMRIGKKYQLDDIFDESLERLKAQFPQTLDAYDSSMNDALCEFSDWILDSFEDIMRFGEEMALWSILPITYYSSTYYEQSVVSQTYNGPRIKY